MKKIFSIFSLLILSISSFGFTYRTISSGNFSSPSIWEYSTDGINWTNAIVAPIDGSHSCIVQTSHTLTLDQNIVLNDNNSGTASSFTVLGSLVFNSHFIQGEGISTGGSSFILGENATLNISNINGLRNGNLGALRNFASYTIHPLANYIFSASSTQTMNLGIDSSVNNITINANGTTVNSAEHLIIYGTLTISSGALFLNHSFTIKGNPIQVNPSALINTGNNAELHFKNSNTGQSIPSSITQLKKLELNSTISNSIQLNSHLRITAANGLILTKGILNCSSHVLTLESDLPVLGNSSSFINGTLSILVETFSSSHYEFINYPIGVNSYQPCKINLATITNTGGSYLSVKAFESIPTGTPNLNSLGGTMMNRYWNIKVIQQNPLVNTNNMYGVANIDLEPSNISPSLSSNHKIGFSLNNSANSFSGISSSVAATQITSVQLDSTQISDLGSNDGSFIGIAKESLPSGTYCVGPASSYIAPSGASYANANSPYPTLSAALTALNSLGNSGHITFELQNDYVSSGETFPINISYKGDVNRRLTIKVRNDNSSPLQFTQSITNGTGLIQFNGAKYVSLDGSINATCGSYGIALKNNASYSIQFAPGYSNCISFINDSKNIHVSGIQFEVADRGINFNNNLGTTGSDSITISCNKFKVRSDLMNTNCYPYGIAFDHDGYSNPTATSNDIKIHTNLFENMNTGIKFYEGVSGEINVSNNHFYKNTNNSPGPSFQQFISNGKPLNFVIDQNYFGGSEPYCAGSKMNLGNSPYLLLLGASSPSSNVKSLLSNNHFENMIQTSGTNIYCARMDGSCVWDITGNTFGNPNVSSDISSTSNDVFYGIYYISPSNSTTNSLVSKIENNSFNNIQLTSSTGSYFYGLYINGTGTAIKNNSFKNITHSGYYGFQMIQSANYTPLSGQTTEFSYNTAENIVQSNSTTLNEIGIFKIISGFGLPVNLNCVGNRIGNLINPDNIVFNGSNIKPFYIQINQDAIRVDSNTICNVRLNNALSNTAHTIFSIYATATLSCAYNSVFNIDSKSKYIIPENANSYSSLTGLYLYSSGVNNITECLVHHNKLSNLNLSNTTSQINGLSVTGLMINGNATNINYSVYENELYGFTNQAISTGSTPYIYGILYGSFRKSIFYNNRISISNGSNSNAVNITGLCKLVSNIPFSCYHNSICIGGTSSALSKSYAFKKADGNGTDTIKNNIFQNVRSGSGLNYALGNSSLSSSTWAICNYNNLYSNNTATTIESILGTSSTISHWQTFYGKDINSKNLYVTFVDSANDLHISTASNCAINGAGTATSISVDVDEQPRSNTKPDIGADEFEGDILLEAGTEKFICKDSLQLNATMQPGTTGFWTGTGVTFTPSNTDPNAVVHGLSNGINNLIWHVSNAVCVAIDTLKLHVGTSPAPITTNYVNPICHDREVQIHLGSPIATGMWSNGDTSQNLIVHPSSTTTYSIIGTDIYNCPLNYSLLVETIPLGPLVQASPSLPINGDNNVLLPVTLAWNPGIGSDNTHLLIWKGIESRPSSGDIVTSITTKQFNNLLNQEEYHWQLMSMNVCDTVYSDTSKFTINLPDLTVSELTFPAEVYANTYANFSWKTTNSSPAGNTNNKTWYDIIGITTDTSIGISNNIGFYQNLSYLAGGASYVQQKSIYIPNGLYGKYYVQLYTDGGSHLIEPNESNNKFYDSIFIKRQPVPDIKVISLASPTNAFAGDSITITYTIENDGEIATNASLWQDEIFISKLPVFNIDSSISCGSFYSKNYKFDTLNGTSIIQTPIPFEVDSTYFSQSKIKLPTNLQSGNYYLYVKANKSNAINEGIYSNNNIAKSPIVLDLTQLPPSDLIVDSMQVPSIGYSGLPITLSWKVKNQGSAITAVSNWVDRVYINTSNTISGAILLGSYIRNNSLMVDSSYTATLSPIIPNGISGNYFFIIKTDDANSVFEFTYDSNNVKISNVVTPIQLSPSPDLVIANIYFSNDTITKSSNVELNYTIKNIGTAPTTGMFATNCYYSDSITYGGVTQIRSTINTYSSIAAGDSIVKKVSFPAPPNIGTYYYFVQTDATYSQYEHTAEINNTTNGVQLTTIQPIPTYSNLIIDSIIVSNAFVTQQAYPINFVVRNLGPNQTSSNYFHDQVYLSTDSVLSEYDIQLKQVPHSGYLDPNQSYSTSTTFTLPEATINGQYYLIVQSDRYYSNSNDTNKTDNMFIQLVSITQAPSPDLEVISISIPDTMYANQLVWFKYTVRNNGPASINSKSISDRIFFTTNNTYLNPYNTIGFQNKIRTLASGDTYTDSTLITIPTYASSYYYFIIKTDHDNLIYESSVESNNILSQLCYINTSPGTDLVPVSLNFQSTNVDLGSTQEVQYAFTNTGTKTILANTRNAVHLSKIEGSAASNYMLQYKDSLIQVQSGDTITDIIHCTIKDAPIDTYQSSININTTLSYPEDSIQNNEFKGDSIHVNVTELFPSIPITRYLKYGDLLYFRLNAPADNDLAITINQLSGSGQNTGRISYEKVPSLSNADIIADDEKSENQILLIPGTSAGNYYILINNKEASVDSQLVSITAQFLPLSIISITNDEGGQGEITTTLKGASFRSNSTIQLKQGGLTFATGSIIGYKNSMEMEVLWDLTNTPLGIYDVVITNGTQSASLPSGFTVELAEEFDIVMEEKRFGNFSVSKKCGASITFTNIGNTNIPIMIVGHTGYGNKDHEGPIISESELFEQLFDNIGGGGSSDPNKGYVLNFKPGASVKLKWNHAFPSEGNYTYGHFVKGYTKEKLTEKLFYHAEDMRRSMLEYLVDNHPELIPIFGDRAELCNIVMEPFLEKNMISLVHLQELIDQFGDLYIDFDPGIKIGTQVESEIELKSTDVYRWEINVPTTTLGGIPGKELGWDLIRSLSDINITANSTEKFEIAIIPRSPCSHAYTTLTTWEPWHDYKWAIAVADGNVNGFDPSKFRVDTYFFEKVNNMYGGHFEVSSQNDSIFLEFKHKERVAGEQAYNGGPGLCGFPGGNGETDLLGGRGGDGGRGWGEGSAGGNGGAGNSGGGAGGLGGANSASGADGSDTNLDNDGDGVPDNIDVCPNTYNVAQSDTDGDGIGNDCDPNPSTPDIDTDGDGIIDPLDNSPLIKNPSQKDTDGDGIPDAEDNLPNWNCIAGVSCPKPYDCVGAACQDEETQCSSCNQVNEEPQGPAPSAEDKCNEYLNKTGCPRAAIGCFKGIMSEIASNGGSMDPFSTIGARNKALLMKAYLECGLDLLEECLDIKIPKIGCALAVVDAVGEAIKLKPTLSGASSTGQAVADECMDISIDEVKIACGIISIYFPRDPNEIHGPDGRGDTTKRWIPATSPLPYTISFENDSLLATTSAERVIITQQIPANLDPLSFKLGTISFQNMTFNLPALPNYTGIINLNDSLNYDVEVTAGLDIINNKLFWVLQTIDPTTGLPPNVTNGGFLPINDSLGNGQGSVTYTINAKSTVQTLDTVAAKASIVFDTNLPIETNTWKNTFDNGLPISSIDTLPSFIPTDSISIPISSSDDMNGSGVYFTRLYYQINNGEFQYYGVYNPNDTALFNGIEGNVYGFYTLATDTAGNEESPKSSAQWTVQFGYPDSLKLKSNLSNYTFCEQSIIPIEWNAYHVDSIQIQVLSLSGSILYSTNNINGNDTSYNWTVPTIPFDTVIFRITKSGNYYLQESDTIIIQHIKNWYQDADHDQYYIGQVVSSCTSPGIDYSNNIIAGGDCNDNDSSVHPNAAELCCNSIDENCNGLINEATLQLKLYLQGYYLGSGLMASTLNNQTASAGVTICDSVEIQLRDINNYSIIATSTSLLSTDGTINCGFSNLGGTFYIVVKHRNSIETWSADPITISPITNYDFTSSANQSYGSNQIEIENGVWAIYSGDINQDKNIDLLDASFLEVDINNFEFGYFGTDINGDGNVDLLDAPLVETNINNFIFAITP